MQISRAELEAYGASVDAAGVMARADLEQRLRQLLALFRPDMSMEEWYALRQELIDLLADVRQYWGDAAAVAAAEFYDATVGASGSLAAAELFVEANKEQISESVKAMAKYLFENNIDSFITEMLNNAELHTRRAANDTILGNVGRDRNKGVRYARVPTGAETCDFCILLASRGFKYYSRKSAGEQRHFHRHCDCRIVAAYDRDTVEGYDPKELLDEYNRRQEEKQERMNSKVEVKG